MDLEYVYAGGLLIHGGQAILLLAWLNLPFSLHPLKFSSVFGVPYHTARLYLSYHFSASLIYCSLVSSSYAVLWSHLHILLSGLLSHCCSPLTSSFLIYWMNEHIHISIYFLNTCLFRCCLLYILCNNIFYLSNTFNTFLYSSFYNLAGTNHQDLNKSLQKRLSFFHDITNLRLPS